MRTCIVLAAVVLLLLLLSRLRLGVLAAYGPEGIQVKLRAGPFVFQVFPGKKKGKKKKKAPKKEKLKPDVKALLPLIRELLPVGLEALGGFRQRLRIDRLTLRLIWGEEDPADAAIHYGYLWGAVEALLSFLEANFVLVRRDIALDLDYQRSKPEVALALGLSLTLGQILAVSMPAAVQALKILWNYNRSKRTAPPRQSAGAPAQ